MKIEFVSRSSKQAVDLNGFCFFEGDQTGDGKILSDAELSRQIKQAAADKLFAGKDQEGLLLTNRAGKHACPVLLLGLGKKDDFTLEKLRIAGARLLSQAKSLGGKRVLLEIDGAYLRFSVQQLAQAAAEGALLSDYSFSKYKSKAKPKRTIEWLGLIVGGGASQAGAIKKALDETCWVARAVTAARDLANEPGNIMTPVELSRRTKALAAANGLRCTVLGKDKIRQLKMGGILAVSQGSSFPPQLIILENRVRTKSAPVVLVGKGITFDTGGISIKPSNEMDKMKFDMCGAAAVIGTMVAVARLR
ncbi:MAG: M17 family peptidase N-terminal domain-containing protein, partial [Candidatus Omnitrophota bacterium]